jgi:pimeloyl-ACP methyl ester carboxylesterase
MKSLNYLSIILVLLSGCGSDPEKNKSVSLPPTDSIAAIDSIEISSRQLSYKDAYDKALLLWGIPYEEKAIKTRFGNAQVIICGPPNGEPLVLLHGMNASSTMWYPNIASLSGHYRIYAIDFLLEPGKSLCQGEISGTDEIVGWYDEIFDQLKLDHFSILGASRGGWMAIKIALHEKERVTKIALLSPAQAFIWIKPGSKMISNLTYELSPKRKRLRHVLQTMTFDVDNISQVYIDQYYIGTREAKMNKCILEMTPFSDDELRSLAMPVLVLIGDNDIINNAKSLEKARELIPHVETATIRNAGHFLSIDQPAIVDNKILDFLNKKDNLSAKK